MRKSIITISLLTLCLGMSGCKTINNAVGRILGNSSGAVSASIVAESNNTIEDAGVIHRFSENIGDSAENIEESATIIEGHNDRIFSATTDPDIQENSLGIRQEVGNIRQDTTSIKEKLNGIADRTVEIQESQKEIQKSNTKVVELEMANRELQKETEKLANESKKKLYSILAWFFGLGVIIGIAGGVTAIWEKKVGIMIAAIGIITMGIAAASTFYLEWVALIGGITMIVAVLSTVGILLWKHRNTIFDAAEKEEYDEASTHLINMIDKVIKPELSEEVREKIFGDGGLADQWQSETTREIVQLKRGSLDTDGE